jgi:hypothetical protein
MTLRLPTRKLTYGPPTAHQSSTGERRTVGTGAPVSLGVCGYRLEAAARRAGLASTVRRKPRDA